MKILKFILIILVFMLGWVSNSLYSDYNLNFEKPSITGLATLSSPSPSNRLSMDNLQFYPNRVVITYPGISGTTYSDTKSMLPTINKDSIGLEIPVNAETTLDEGDIIAYEKDSELFVHRVKRVMDGGKFYIVAGDNLKSLGNEIVSRDQIRYVNIGVLY